MDKALKEDWMEALRSGQHYQCADKLENSNGQQCCLGVLCDIMDVPRHDERFGMVEYGHGTDKFLWSASDLPNPTRRKAGITTGQESELITLNDEHKATFAEIADWIEVNL